MHALRNIHAALTTDGLLADTQPLSPHPRITAGGTELGTLDMHDWAGTIRAVDARIAEAIAAGFFELQHEGRFTVTDAFDDGRECLETVSNWRDTRVPPSLVSQLETTRATVTIEQEVRLRLFGRA